MQIRIKNTNLGARGAYISGELVFIGGGATATYSNATDDDVTIASGIDGLKVQSSEDGNSWKDHFTEVMPEEKPWVAIATDAQGGNFKIIEGNPWMVGTALSSEKPESYAAFTWAKIGDAEVAAIVAEPAPEPEPDYVELVKGNATDVIVAITAENADQIGAAEENRKGGPRKGVMKAVEEAMVEPDADDNEKVA